MVSTTKQRPMASQQVPINRLLLLKHLRRLFRTIRTEWRLFLARPLRPRPWTVPLILTIVALILFNPLFGLIHAYYSHLKFREPHREHHFTHKVHTFLPRPKAFEQVQTRPCSWLYAEFNARDGRFVDDFLTEGKNIFEEYLRATQSTIRSFCVIAFDADPLMAKPLNNIRSQSAKRTRHFEVFPQFVPGALNASENVWFRAPKSMTEVGTRVTARSIALKDFIDGITFRWEESGRETPKMNLARGNGNLGSVILRFNVLTPREAYWYLDLLEASSPSGVMCSKVDRLVFNFERVDLERAKQVLDIDDRDVARDWDNLIGAPSSPSLSADNGFAGIMELAKEISARPHCRTVVHVLDESGKVVHPEIVSNKQVYYAILAGQPTFDERVGAQTETWMTAVPQDRLTIFTNIERNEDELKAARGRQVAVVQPHRPELEQRLSLMQSWSHLVRVRESWDRAMKDNTDIKWLALVDDDTFVFPGGLREYLSMFDNRAMYWGGSGEQARIDNGDSGPFAHWLRDLNKKYGGRHCYMQNEMVPKEFAGKRIEYKVSQVLNGRRAMHRVSHMCEDAFCRMGCPAVPQGAAIVMSRSLVEALRPHIEQCEQDTRSLCKNCGSQRLYMCVNRYVKGARTLLTRGICRAPWKLEHRLSFPFALTYHGFGRYRGRFLSTSSLRGDMVELWQLGSKVEQSVKFGYLSSYLIRMQSISDLIGCRNQGRYRNGKCVSEKGIEMAASDGREAEEVANQHGASARNGSA